MTQVCAICGCGTFTFKQSVIQTITINTDVPTKEEVVDNDVYNKSPYVRCTDCNQISFKEELITEKEFHETVATNNQFSEDILSIIRERNISVDEAALVAQARIVFYREDNKYTVIKSVMPEITGEYSKDEAETVFHNEGIVLVLNDGDGLPTINWNKGGI